MALSIFTNGAAMSSMNALNKSNSILSTAMERLGTGKRINSAADDAAGLQIATRLQGQVNGMAVAQRNVSDATAMLQTAEGSFDEVTNILYRMKDLATQAANDTNGTDDRTAIGTEMGQLVQELGNIMLNTSYAGEKLFATDAATKFDDVGGKFGDTTAKVNFQIGASSDEKLELDISAAVGKVMSALEKFGDPSTITAITIADSSAATTLMDNVQDALDEVGSTRSSIGANINRLGHTSANLANMKDNTALGLGNIRDADFATEATNMTRNQMLAQTSMSMLKQANSMSGMVMSLLG